MNINRSAQLLLLAAAFVFVLGVALAFKLDNYELQVGTSLAMLCALCWSWNIVGGYMGYPALSTATFFGVGTYVDAITQVAGGSIYLAWAAAALAGAVVALLLGLPLLRLKGHYFAIGTLATVEVFREVANNWEWLTGGVVGLNLPIPPGTPAAVGRFFFIAMLALSAFAFVLTLLVDRSRFGFGLRCIRQNERAASMVGVDVLTYKVGAFVLSSAIAAAAGGIYVSMIGYIEPSDAFNLTTTIEVPVMVMIGGMGTLLGPLIGGVLYVLLKEFVWAHFLEWHDAILGVIIVAAIYYLPSGVIGFRLPRWRKRAAAPLGARNALT